MLMFSFVALLLVPSQPATTPQRTPEQVVRAMFEAFNRHDAAGMARLYAEDARLDSSDFCAPRRGVDVVRTYSALFAAYPDVRDEIETLIASGNQVAVLFTVHATTEAQSLVLPMIAIIKVRDGLIVEDNTVFDTSGAPCLP